MKTRWERLLHACKLSTPKGNAVFNDLAKRYAESHRHYHNLDHIEHCLNESDALPETARHPAFEFALWFHDAIYDPNRPDNEAASAFLAREALTGIGWDAASIGEVERLILATDHRVLPIRDDEKLIVDIDLSILGQAGSRYDSYADAIRREYTHVPEAAYRQGRATVLRGFLDREEIYATADFQRRFEHRARENLKRELAWLD